MTARTTKATTTKTAAKVAPDYDFDGWDAEREEAAIAALAEASRVRYIVVEDNFVARFPDGHVIKCPLNVSPDDIRQIQDSTTTDDQIGQVMMILRTIGSDHEADYLGRASLPSVVSFTEQYFRVFAKITGASVGE